MLINSKNWRIKPSPSKTWQIVSSFVVPKKHILPRLVTTQSKSCQLLLALNNEFIAPNCFLLLQIFFYFKSFNYRLANSQEYMSTVCGASHYADWRNPSKLRLNLVKSRNASRIKCPCLYMSTKTFFTTAHLCLLWANE